MTIAALASSALVAAGATAGPADAAGPALPSGCVVSSGRTVVCTYGPGAYTFAQPSGVSQVRVRVVGGAGGKGGDATDGLGTGAAGGAGAVLTNTVSITKAGLEVRVGTRGGDGGKATLDDAVVTPGGAGGAGAAGHGGQGGPGRRAGGGGGGGGASSVSAPDYNGGAGPLLVLAGGGGGGGGVFGDNRGQSTEPGDRGGVDGGAGGTANYAGGAGFSTDENDSQVAYTEGGPVGAAHPSRDGLAGPAVSAGSTFVGGAGAGGGGFDGGGAGQISVNGGGGGGAGGTSNQFYDGGTDDPAGNPDGNGQVTITYDQPAPATAVTVRGAGVLTATGGQRVSIGADVRVGTSGPPTGRVGVAGASVAFASKSIASVTRQGATATVTGTATFAGGRTGPFTLVVRDRGKARDQVTVTANGRTISGTITTGDIAIT